MIRKSGNSNGFLFYAFLSLFCGFITQSARARVANLLTRIFNPRVEINARQMCGTSSVARCDGARDTLGGAGAAAAAAAAGHVFMLHAGRIQPPTPNPRRTSFLSLLRCSLLADRINPSANYACSLIISPRQIRIVIIFKWPLALPPLLLYSLSLPHSLFDISGTVVVVYTFHMLRKSLLQL